MADPRQALVQQMLQSKRGSPDLPGPQAIQQLQSTPTDGMIQQFLDQFGVARTQNPNGPVPGEIPMPRPRQPDMAEGPMGRYPSGEMPLGTMSTSDVQRGVMGDEGGDLPRETIPDQMTDEDMLNSVSNQMGGGGELVNGEDMEQDKATLESTPTDGNISKFVDIWGEENLPASMRNPDNAGADDYAGGGD